MLPVIIIILLILLLRSMMASNKSANIPTKTVPVKISSCGSAGDNFTCGRGLVAGVSEPHCNMIRTGPVTGWPGVPVPSPVLHVTYPVDPPPISIQKPVLPKSPILPAPMPVRPIPEPIFNPGVYSNYIGSGGGGGPLRSNICSPEMCTF